MTGLFGVQPPNLRLLDAYPAPGSILAPPPVSRYPVKSCPLPLIPNKSPLAHGPRRPYLPLMPLFTRDNAAIMARKANLVRWSRPEPPATPPQLPEPGAPEIAAQTRAQIQAIDARLTRASSMDAETLDLLTRSKERLWKVLAHAAQIPQPAHVKQERRRRSDAIDLEPIPVAVLPDLPAQVTDASPAPPSSDQPEGISLEP